MPFLMKANFGKLARYMIVLGKLHWFRTNHHVGTEKEGIARSLSGALDRALRAMPVEDNHISESYDRAFFIKHLHTISHWAKTIGLAGMLVCALHPKTTMAKAPCFTPEGGRKTTELAQYG